MVKKMSSMANGSDAVYAGNDVFRIRKTENGTLRIHIVRDAVRVRPDYYAMDLNLEDFVQAAGMIAAKNV
jgi:hypothetical protein